MDATTVARLCAINARFYEAAGAEFSDTRRRGWPGWQRVATRLPAREPLHVLDLGCGNGRLIDALRESGVTQLDYLGLDASEALLSLAHESFGEPGLRFERAELPGEGRRAHLPRGPFDFIALFALLHHVPGRDRRRRLLAAALEPLAPGGVLAVSLWRFERSDRHEKLRIDWRDYNASSDRPIDLDQLEPGDVLLRFGKQGAPPRYCHFGDDDEIDALLGAQTRAPCERFDADGEGGRLNHYALFRNDDSPSAASADGTHGFGDA